MLTSYTLRRQAEEAREVADSSVARAPDPAPAVAPDPAPARAPTVEELLAALDSANEELTALRDELSRASTMFDALPEQMATKIDETVAERMATAKAEHEARLVEAQKTIAALEEELEKLSNAKDAQASIAENTIAQLEQHAISREGVVRENERLQAELAAATETNAELGKQLDAALARIAELEAPASPDAAPTGDAAPAAEPAPSRRRR